MRASSSGAVFVREVVDERLVVRGVHEHVHEGWFFAAARIIAGPPMSTFSTQATKKKKAPEAPSRGKGRG